MKSTFFLGVLSLSMVVFSCKKNDTSPSPASYQIMEPQSYLPAYPGSYWIYSNGDTLKVADEYQKYTFNSSDSEDGSYTGTVFLPQFLPNNIFYQDYSSYINGYAVSSQMSGAPFFNLLSETEGATYSLEQHYGGQLIGHTLKTDTAITVNGRAYSPVLVVVHYAKELCNDSPAVCAFVKEYYAKDVGLIKREYKLDGQTEYTYLPNYSLELVAFKINK